MVKVKVKMFGVLPTGLSAKMNEKTLKSLRRGKTRKTAQEKQKRMKRHSHVNKYSN